MGKIEKKKKSKRIHYITKIEKTNTKEKSGDVREAEGVVGRKGVKLWSGMAEKRVKSVLGAGEQSGEKTS